MAIVAQIDLLVCMCVVELMHTEVIIIKAIEVKKKLNFSISGGPHWPGGPQHVLKVLHGKSGPGWR